MRLKLLQKGRTDSSMDRHPKSDGHNTLRLEEKKVLTRKQILLRPVISGAVRARAEKTIRVT